VKRNYYCLVAGLQDLTLDAHKLTRTQNDFRIDLQTDLHPQDYKLVEYLFYPVDNKNLLNLLEKSDKEFDLRGCFTREEMEDNIKEPSGILPQYMDQFINAYKNNEPFVAGMSFENQLITLFYSFTATLNDGFLEPWYRFNRDLNNLLTAMVCRKYDIPYENQVIGDDEITEAIRRSHARDFGLSAEIPWMEDVMNIAKTDNVQEKEKAIDKLKWNYLEDVTFFEYFTIDRVLAFIIKIGIVERWLALDREYGTELFMELLKELKSSYKLPETFTEK